MCPTNLQFSQQWQKSRHQVQRMQGRAMDSYHGPNGRSQQGNENCNAEGTASPTLQRTWTGSNFSISSSDKFQESVSTSVVLCRGLHAQFGVKTSEFVLKFLFVEVGLCKFFFQKTNLETIVARKSVEHGFAHGVADQGPAPFSTPFVPKQKLDPDCHVATVDPAFYDMNGHQKDQICVHEAFTHLTISNDRAHGVVMHKKNQQDQLSTHIAST